MRYCEGKQERGGGKQSRRNCNELYVSSYDLTDFWTFIFLLRVFGETVPVGKVSSSRLEMEIGKHCLYYENRDVTWIYCVMVFLP